ncbi:pseudouridylate synthase 7 homolog isoform X4 [Hordeum vulgare subsp. vulgare]|uniref:pseudouridylate synthase 7 homolog isoform X4 n=1 Tax=Hordeum vulgare subsp. vulgare TaxID=112509 RepID=UPI001D1A5101|nr:pseudouridylate synthase 7 homolog isoform X4 [Hordeum vulgare subsp. vulgare]XP_044977217.1 pseudouridylate synthase 7 homolog isoform X4 [Hordeum vulgare subsp. vulgare]
MRCRHFLNPLLSPLSFAKPPSRPLASRARAVAQPPAQAQRRAALAEPDVGISRFASSLPGFRGVLKQRYSDFVVHEVARDGTLVRLTSFDLPDERADTDDEANADLPHALDSFRLLCGDADAEALRGFLSRVSEGDSNVSPIILSPDADKAHRLEVHDFFKRNFIFLVTDTVEHSDGVQRCIRVRLRSGPRGRRNVGEKASNRTGIGSSEPSGWRDDMPFDSRGSITWPYHLGKFLRFHLYKENKDTQEALRVIGKMLGLQPRSFRIAGTKDKRAITTQQVTLFKVHASRLAALNNKLTGIKVGDFNYVKEGLVLGQLMGNRFTITLRSVIAESEDVIKAAVDGLIKSGFINYYGLQRFGSASVPTHLVGAALLRGEWRSAVSLILDPREGEYDDMNGVREHYKEHGDIDVAIRNFPRRLIAERAILQRLKKYPGNYLQALMAIPRTLRLMYVHSYQSYLWNHAASMRAGIYGLSGVIEGDLVYKKECLGEGTLTDTSKNNDDHTIASEMDIFVETLPEETIQSVKIADSEDLLKAVYTLEDVVLPLPGSETLFPGNEVAGIYHEIANKDGISLTKSIHGVKEFSITSMKGGYRRVLQRPIDCKWYFSTPQVLK